MAECPSFLRQINTPLDGQTTSCLSVHPSLDSWVACWHIMCYVAFQSCALFGGKKALKITCSAICWVNSTHARTRPPPTPWPGPGCHPETGGAHDLSPGAFLTPTGWGEVTPTHQPLSTRSPALRELHHLCSNFSSGGLWDQDTSGHSAPSPAPGLLCKQLPPLPAPFPAQVG